MQNREFNSQNERALGNNMKMDMAVATIDSADIGVIFGMFLKEFLHKLLEEVGKYILFPIAAAAAVIRAILAWRQAKLDGGKTGSVVRALVETGAAVAITVAVIGALVATTTFATIAPAIFTGVTGAKTLFHAGSAFYYWGKSAATSNLAKKREYREKAKGNGIAAIAGGLVTVAVAAVMIFGKWAMAGFGIAAGIIGTAYAVYKGCSSSSPRAQGYQPVASEPNEQEGLSQNARIMKSVLDFKHQSSLDVKEKKESVASVKVTKAPKHKNKYLARFFRQSNEIDTPPPPLRRSNSCYF